MSLGGWFLVGVVMTTVTLTWGMCIVAGSADARAARMSAKADAEDAAKAAQEAAERERRDG